MCKYTSVDLVGQDIDNLEVAYLRACIDEFNLSDAGSISGLKGSSKKDIIFPDFVGNSVDLEVLEKKVYPVIDLPDRVFRPIDVDDKVDIQFSGVFEQYQRDLAVLPLSNVSNEHGDEIEGTKGAGFFPSLPPIIGVRLKSTTVEVVRAAGEYRGGGVRGAITEITSEQFKNAIEVLTNSDVELNSLMTVTYPDIFPWDGRIVKAHWKALRRRLVDRFGEFGFFVALEYQDRGAPHLHIGMSLDLGLLGDKVVLKRDRGLKRRSETFVTVKELQDWVFNQWVEVLAYSNDGEIRYNGRGLFWAGLSTHSTKMMYKAYYEHNSGFSWEVMRDKDGAKKYFVKELTGKKKYQKLVPVGFENPGRHFWWSNGFKFDESLAIDFNVSEGVLRDFLKGFEFVPGEDKPLFRRLWNLASDLAIRFVEAGLLPFGGLEALRQYVDLRVHYFSDRVGESFRFWASLADSRVFLESEAYWLRIKAKIFQQQGWDFIIQQELAGI